MVGRGSVRAGTGVARNGSNLQQLVTIEEPVEKPMRSALQRDVFEDIARKPSTSNPPWTAIDAGDPARTEPRPTGALRAGRTALNTYRVSSLGIIPSNDSP